MENWTFKATPKLVEELGKKWEGTFEVKELTAKEYLTIGDEYVDDLQKGGMEIVNPEDVKQTEFNRRMLFKTILHNGKPIKPPIPAKLFAMLMPFVIQRNTVTPIERREDFLEFTTTKNSVKKSPRSVSQSTT